MSGPGTAVNFIAHVIVALSAVGDGTPEDELAFGAALPDLVSMAGLRIEPSTLPELVRQGVTCHHRTDTAFHSLVEFTTGVSQLRRHLTGGGMAVGPSRAIGHAGWELLLDGCLLDRPGVEEGFTRVMARAPDVAESVSPDDPDRWRRLCAGMRTDKWYLGYRDDATVAHRLQRRLRDRRRLCFATEEIPVVTEALRIARPAVGRAAAGVMSAVIAAVAGSPHG
jgi:acyl carrier protein phosphodiesterase